MKLRVCLILLFFLYGCATFIPSNCADESIAAAEMYGLRTGHPTYIGKSADGTHAQAFALKDGKRVWLKIYPRFEWGVEEAGRDHFGGGLGKIYTVDEFKRGHGWINK